MGLQDANTVGAYDAKTHFSELLEKVASGEEITITRHGAPIARLVPVKRKYTPAERSEAIKRIKELGKGLTLGGMKIRGLIEKGRR